MTYSTLPPQDYLRTLGAIRDRCYQVYEKAQNGQLCYFEVDESKLGAAVDHVAELTRRRFSDLNSIPPHSRLRHFDETFGEWRQKAQQRNDNVEFARKLVDIVVVSVLLDAGAGQEWKYTTHYGKKVGRSEGLAIASVDMFLGGYFSSDDTDRVDGKFCDKLYLRLPWAVITDKRLSSRSRGDKCGTYGSRISSYDIKSYGRSRRKVATAWSPGNSPTRTKGIFPTLKWFAQPSRKYNW